VYLKKTCPEHGRFSTMIWRGLPAYSSWVRPKTPAYPDNPFTRVERGCPFDCGLCPEHRQQTCSALLEVTQRCDLFCSVCFASAGECLAPDPDLRTVQRWYERLLTARGPCNIQLSGGEPCLRDDLPDIIRLGRSLGFTFLQVNTNGLRIAREPGYLRRLQDAGLSTVFLQFDSTRDEAHEILRGRRLLAAKRTAIERCCEQGIGVVLVPTLVPGVNTDEVGDIVEFALQYAPGVRGVHFQPVSYFGRFPFSPRDVDRITLPEIMRSIELQTNGLVKSGHFKPAGCENAVCSFHGQFVMMPDGTLVSLTHRAAEKSCGCQAEPGAEGAERARRFVARNWSPPAACAEPWSELTLGEWNTLLARAKTHTFCISAMAFQDAWTLDLERLRDCCIHTLSPDGRIIPFCAYNLTDQRGQSLYRPALTRVISNNLNDKGIHGGTIRTTRVQPSLF
jgi:uncharacterized radical SAM superfamily Fe-S cluster-containing enzyme